MALDAFGSRGHDHTSLGSNTGTAARMEVVFWVPWVQGLGSPSHNAGGFEPQVRHNPLVPRVPFSGALPHSSPFGKMSCASWQGVGRGGEDGHNSHFHGLWTRKDGHVWD